MSRECCKAGHMCYQVYRVDGICLKVCLLIWAACCVRRLQQPRLSHGRPACSDVCCQPQAVACRHSGQSLAYWRPQHRAAEVTLERGHMMQRVGEHWAQGQSYVPRILQALEPDCAHYRVPC